MSSIVILAAGNGSRLKSSLPKIYHKIGGLSLLDHVIKSACNIASDNVVVVARSDHPIAGLKYKDRVSFAFQSVPNGSGDAVKCAISKIPHDDGWTYVLYGDIPLISPETLEKLNDVSRRCDKTRIVVLAMKANETTGLGKLEPDNEDGTIKAIVEAKDAEKFGDDGLLPLCNAGLFIKNDILHALIEKIQPSQATGEVYITEIVKLAHRQGFVCRYHEADASELSGVNTRAELAVLEKYFQDKMRKKHLDNGVTLVAPDTVFFSYDTEIENDVVIHPYVVFSENVKLKSGASVGPFCVVEGSEIGKACIGPFARIRPGSEIRDEARIGNFVEIKNSVVAEKSKVNHLSYIGDSSVGRESNIGAGSVTCNYDGFEKHKTQIGEKVFIGSNSSLVAPVKIHDNAMIGAGSVITKDVEDGALAIARERQVNIANGAINFRENRKK
jgi:bifunctional UDP-N-acetylglucosamine pyrophosphorylase/glucosamine-1-phosphate N-acetyltransferase